MGHTQLNVNVPAALAERFSQVVKRDRRTKTATVVALIEEWTDRTERQLDLAANASESASC